MPKLINQSKKKYVLNEHIDDLDSIIKLICLI